MSPHLWIGVLHELHYSQMSVGANGRHFQLIFDHLVKAPLEGNGFHRGTATGFRALQCFCVDDLSYY